MSQTTYVQNFVAEDIGLLADSRSKTIESFASEGAIPFGQGLVEGTDAEKQVKVAATAGDNFAGISVKKMGIEQASNGDVEYADKEAVNVLKKGIIYALVTANVTYGEAAYVNIAIGAKIGQFTNVSTANLAVPTGIFRSTTSADGIAKIEINIP